MWKLWISFQVFTFFPELIVSERVAPLFICNSNVQLWSRFQWIVPRKKIKIVEWVSRWTRWDDVQPPADGINWTLTFWRFGCAAKWNAKQVFGRWLFIDRSQLSVAKLAAWWWHHFGRWATAVSRSRLPRIKFEMILSEFGEKWPTVGCVSVRRHKEIVNGAQS